MTIAGAASAARQQARAAMAEIVRAHYPDPPDLLARAAA